MQLTLKKTNLKKITKLSLNMQRINLHLISDSTGETIGAISRAVLSQFTNVEAEEFVWSLVRTRGQIEKIAQEIKKKTRDSIIYNFR